MKVIGFVPILRSSEEKLMPTTYPSSCKTVGWGRIYGKRKMTENDFCGFLCPKTNKSASFLSLYHSLRFTGHSQNTSDKRKSSNGKGRFTD